MVLRVCLFSFVCCVCQCTYVLTNSFISFDCSGTQFVNDLHVLDLGQSRWEQLFVAGTAPSPRSRHSAVFVGARMFVLFGGDDARVYDDVHAFDVRSRTWRELETTGDRPCARWGRTLFVFSFLGRIRCLSKSSRRAVFSRSRVVQIQ